MEVEVMAPGAELTQVNTALEEAVSQWLAELDLAERSRTEYGKSIRRYVSFLQSNGLTGGHRTDVLSYKAALTADYAPTTVSAYLVPVRRFYTWLSATTGAPNVAADIRGAKVGNKPRKQELSVVQARNVLQIHTGSSLQELRDRAIVSLLLRTALRTVEVVRADVKDMTTSAGKTVLYVQGKGREAKDELVLIEPDVEEQIRAYLSARGPVDEDAPLFASTSRRNGGGRMTTRSISRIAKETLKSAGLDSPKLTAHSYRHTAVTLSLLGGASLQDAQAMARHRNINTTMIYAHNINRTGDNAGEHAISRILATA